MSRILGIDYGLKRCGLAWTDPLQLIATGLESCTTEILMIRISELTKKETINKVVVGYPLGLNGKATDATLSVDLFIQLFEKEHPTIPIVRWDERFTSKIALNTMVMSGVKKEKRKDKSLIDKISAILILQHYLESF